MNTSDSEKACPYCAEIIKSAAIICRYCQRELAANSEQVECKPSQNESGLVPCDNCGGEILASFKKQTEGFCRDCATAAGIHFDSNAEDIPAITMPALPETIESESEPETDTSQQQKPLTTFFAVVGFCTFGFFSLLLIGCVSIFSKIDSSRDFQITSYPPSTRSYKSTSSHYNKHYSDAVDYLLKDSRAAVRNGTWTKREFEDYTGVKY